MHITTKNFTHLPATNIGNGVQGEAIEQLIVIQQIFPNAVEDEMQELVFLVQEQGHGEVSDLLLRVLGSRDELDGFEVAKVDVPPEDIDVQELVVGVSWGPTAKPQRATRTLQTYFFL